MSDRTKLFARYLGETREFPQGMVLNPGEVYEIDFWHPHSLRDGLLLMKVKGPRINLYLPYRKELDIWDDWMPYSGKVV